MLLTTVATRAASTPLDPSKWESEIRTLEQEHRTHAPPPGSILFTGSSSIRLWTNLAAAFPSHAVYRRGFGGSQMSELNHYLERIVLPGSPSHILVYEGDNDIAAGKSPEVVLADFKEFVTKVHSKLPKTRISYLAIKPSKARWHLISKIRETNSLVERYAGRTRRVAFIDTFKPILDGSGHVREELLRADGLHLNEEGYKVWTRVIAPHL